jgi:hypothetical protein
LPLNTAMGGHPMLLQEPEIMTCATPAGSHAAACADQVVRTPRHYLRRLAFHLAARAALRRAELRARTFALMAADRQQTQKVPLASPSTDTPRLSAQTSAEVPAKQVAPFAGADCAPLNTLMKA